MRYFVSAAEHLRNDTGLPDHRPPDTRGDGDPGSRPAQVVWRPRRGRGACRSTIAEGEVYALLGHNGAGKSTIVEILEGHRAVATAANVSVLGIDPASGGRAFRDRIGIVLQTSGVETELTVREAVELYGSAYRNRRPVDEVIELVGLDDKASTRGSTRCRVVSSAGSTSRSGIVGRPEVLFLDEPTTGFDAAARRKSWELIEELCRLGTTVLLTTHYLDEAEHLADRVGVLSRGCARRRGHARRADRPAGRHGRVVHPRRRRAGDMAGVLPPGAIRNGQRVEFTIDRPDHATCTPSPAGRSNAAHVSMRCRSPRPTLEDVFLGLADAEECRRETRRLSALAVWPSTVRLVLRQIHAQLRMFWRTPIALFFTIMLPLIMLVLFNALFGDDTVDDAAGSVADQPVLHRWPGGLHRRQRHVHQPRQHGADPARGGRAQAVAGDAVAGEHLPRRFRRLRVRARGGGDDAHADDRRAWPTTSRSRPPRCLRWC